MLPVAPIFPSEAGPPTLVSSLGENSVEEPLIKDAKGDSRPTLHAPEVKECRLSQGLAGVSSH